MSGDSTYNYKGPDFVIENGILKGATVPLMTKHTHYGDLILDCLRAQPGFVGQINGITGRKETFAEMMGKSVRCALWLKNQNVKSGDIIGVCTHNQTDMYVPSFAALYIGAVFNPWWDVGLTKEMSKYFLVLTKPKVVFADVASARIISEVVKEIGMETKIVVFGNLPDFQPLDDILASQNNEVVSEFSCTKLSSFDDPAILLYTSGSTGLPKGVLHSHKSFIGNIRGEKKIGTNGTVTTMLFSPLAWGTGVLLLLSGVTIPETRVIHPEFNEELTLQLIEKYKINWMLLGTSAASRLQKLASTSKYDLSSLKKMVVTGGVLKEETQKTMAEKFPQTAVEQMYGSTELGCAVSEMVACNKIGSSGRIVQNFSMKVVDTETRRILGPNQKGEARFKSPYMMTCYYNNPEATKEIFDAEDWLRMGDIVHYDEEGFIFVSDRIKEIIKYRGNHVSPAMIERILMEHPGVVEATVLGIPHDVDDEHPIAFVIPSPIVNVTTAELEELVANTLPDCMKLRGGVQFLDQLPHTANGKVARAKLRQLARSYAPS